ncbi:hypothetical protein Micbo1qcDRAFT_178250 [Microdochium bolleyi]|uniref:Uncharacterized protein n=1 Tax=Microdochium bolleyi TaxID=196109 RepID=A0A136ISU9_9PEZI|nr:hypothetical protein Micbo1qcDRAFT_178250 [Microdochium bolleyi]
MVKCGSADLAQIWTRPSSKSPASALGPAPFRTRGSILCVARCSSNADFVQMMSLSSVRRGCWDKRLAHLDLKLVMTRLVWNSAFHRLAGELEDWGLDEGVLIKPQTCRKQLSSA